jgi:V8-like Glu-specific endopeptidase
MKTQVQLLIAPPLALAMAACAAGEGHLPELDRIEQPLIGGVIAVEDHAVVALQYPTSNSAFCTGTLISPSVVLTAAHCVDMFGGDPNIVVFFGTDVRGEGTRVGVKKKIQHPMWAGNVGSRDIALLQINFPQDPFLPVRLNDRVPLSQEIGTSYRHVGFGVYDRTTQASDGRKREGTTTITGVTTSDVVLSGDENLSVCFGDSGGPGLITVDGVELVAGVHSYTNSQDCHPPNGDTRVDLYVQDFIQPWIDANDPACGRDGLCAPIGCTDDPDCTPCGADGTCTTGCALPDPDCPTSGLGEICQADSQCQSGLCVFWQGDLNYKFCTVACDPQNPDCPSGMSCRNVQPFGDVCYFDAPPPGVLGDSCEQATDCGSYLCEAGTCVITCDLSVGRACPTGFECTGSGDAYHCRSTAQDEGGCAAAGRGAAGWPGLVLIGLLAAARRRRRPASAR